MDAKAFLISFPVFGLVLEPDRIPVCLVHGADALLPLFTDRDSAESFAVRAGLLPPRVALVSMPGAAEFRAYVAAQPGDTRVLFDPLDLEPRRVVSFSVGELLDSVDGE